MLGAQSPVHQHPGVVPLRSGAQWEVIRLMRAPASKGVHAYLLGGGSVSQDGISSSVEARLTLLLLSLPFLSPASC